MTDNPRLYSLLALACVIGMASLMGCQTGENANHSEYTPSEEVGSFEWPIFGVWCNGDGCLLVSRDIKGTPFLACLEGDADITFIGQKYFQLETPVCGMSHIVGWQCPPPYDRLMLYYNGQNSAHWRL